MSTPHETRSVTNTLDENGLLISITVDGITLPANYSFDAVNDFIHGTGVHFEELQALCLGMASEQDKLRARVAELEAERDQFAEAAVNAVLANQRMLSMLQRWISFSAVAPDLARHLINETQVAIGAVAESKGGEA